MKRKSGNISLRLGVALLLAGCCTMAWADKIVTRSGQTLEGVVISENPVNVMLDIRGNIIAVPKARIKTMSRVSLDENVRGLMEKATDALKRSDINSARIYVEQAKTLNTKNLAILSEIDKLNAQIQEMELRGGTPEERRMRADVLLERAKGMYDQIRNEEGNKLLLQALIIDPTYDRAHDKINERLIQSGAGGVSASNAISALPVASEGDAGTGASKKTAEPRLSSSSADLLLAAHYFTKVMWPDHVRMDSPVIKLLPQVYAGLVQLFAESNDPEMSREYANLMRTITEAFAQHPTWKETADAKVQTLLDQPFDELLTQVIKESVDKKQYDLALRKLKGVMPPESSVATTILYLRALAGAEQYPEAVTLLEGVMPKFPEDTSLRQQYNALMALIKGQQTERLQKQAAVPFYEQIYQIRQNLIPEIGDNTGRLLAGLKGPDMDPAMAAGQMAKAADVASIVMQYGQDPAMRQRAAQVMIATLQKLPWKMEFIWKINGTPVQLLPETIKNAHNTLRPVLAVQFDQESPFVLRFTVDCKTAAPTAEVVQAISNNQDLAKPAVVTEFQFSLDAMHSTLGTIYHTQWKSSDVPQAAVPFDANPGPPPAPKPAPGSPEAAPAAPPADGGQPVEAAPPAGAPPAPGATPTPTPTPAPAKPKLAKNALLTIEKVDAPGLGKMWSLDIFIVAGNGFLPYVQNWQKVTLLPSHLSVPLAQKILKGE